jgi:hypothetical protein
MPLFAAFCGGSHAERSLTMGAARTVNLSRSTVEAEGAAKTAYLMGTPGRRRLGLMATVGGRGVFEQDGRTWTVTGDQLYELTLNAITGAVTAATARGTIVDDGLLVSWASNGDGGNQLAIRGGGQLKILNLLTNVLSAAIVLPMTHAPGNLGYLDGYFLLNELGTLQVWFCNLENALIWDALDFFTRSTASDRIVTQVCANNRVWVFGSETSEAYEDVGDADNPFQPIKGSLFQIGCAGADTVSVGVSTLRWVGRSSLGGAVVYRLDGYAGTRISTHAIEAALAAATTLADAEAVTLEQDGHLCYALTCPSAGVAGETWVIDETEHEWHQRSAWNTPLGREEAWPVRGHAYVGTVHVTGTRAGAAICALDLATYDDDGAILRAVRRAPYLGAENGYAFLDRIELGIEAGVGLISGQGSDPQVELLVSKDNAKTWWSAGPAGIGAMGEHGVCAVWTRLGRVRMDRLVLEVVITDPVKRAFGPGLWLTVTPGTRAA